MTCVIIKIFPHSFKFLESQQIFGHEDTCLCCDFNEYKDIGINILVGELQIDIDKGTFKMFQVFLDFKR